jgi:hypothetical protein
MRKRPDRDQHVSYRFFFSLSLSFLPTTTDDDGNGGGGDESLLRETGRFD